MHLFGPQSVLYDPMADRQAVYFGGRGANYLGAWTNYFALHSVDYLLHLQIENRP
jgi:hypothetical protein